MASFVRNLLLGNLGKKYCKWTDADMQMYMCTMLFICFLPTLYPLFTLCLPFYIIAHEIYIPDGRSCHNCVLSVDHWSSTIHHVISVLKEKVVLVAYRWF